MKAKPTYEELERRVQELEKIESKYKHSKEALQESENLFRSLYEKAPLGYQSLDENGFFIAVNKTWLEGLGYAKEEVIGKSFADFLHPDWRDHFNENFPRFKAIGDILGVEFEMVKKNGAPILVSFTGKISRDEKGNFQQTHCIFHDITERRLTEEALREKTKFLKNIIDTTSDLVSVTDMQGNFKFIGPSHSILGYNPDSLVGRNVLELVHPDDYQDTATAFADILSNRKDGQKVEYRYRGADGEYFWFETVGKFILDDAGNPKEILFRTRDFTARKQVEGELKRIEWMLSRKPFSNFEAQAENHDQGYGDLTELNRDGIILKSIGHERLKSFASDYLELLGTSSAIYETNGDYAFGIFASGYCRMMDSASRKLCDAADNGEALDSGHWLCHESCWTDCSKRAIAECAPVDIECNGGLRIYAVPILAQRNVVGAINFGYGDPPADPEQLRKLAKTYHLDDEDLVREANACESRPLFIIELAKKRLHATARLIGSMIETKQVEEALRESEEMMRATLYSIGDAVISTNVDGIVVAMNPVAESLTGWNEQEATGQALETVFRIINERTRQPVENPVTNVLKSGQIVGLANHTLLIARDGREIPIADSGAPILNDTGDITGVVLVFRDQTKERAAQEALEKNEATIRNKLKAMVEPDGDIGALNLADIIDAEELQALMEDFYNFSKICSAILDISGNVLVEVGWQDICTKFHRVHPDSAANCLESDLALAAGVPAGTFKAYRCKNNMWDMVSPIKVGETHLGNMYIGQFFYEDEYVDYELFGKQARQHGFEETKYLAALDRVPRLKRETVESAMTFYAKLAGMISSLSNSKIKLSRDIAERNRAKKALQEREEMMLNSQSVARICSYSTNLNVNELEKSSWVCSPEFYKIFGIDETYPHTIEGWAGFIHPDHREGLVAYHEYVVKNRISFSHEYKIIRINDGAERWVHGTGELVYDEQGKPFRMHGAIHDITERKQVEEALWDSEKRFRTLMENIDAIAVQGYGPDGTAQYWNAASERLYGYSQQEVIGRNLLDLIIPPEMKGAVAKEMREMAKSGRPIPSGELLLMHKDGSRVPVISHHALVKVPGRAQELFCLDVDITERKQAEKEREKLQAQLTQAQKMESVGRLAGGIAHDFNNMLSVILGHTEMALEKLDPAEPLFAGLQAVQHAAERSAALTRQLLTFARKQTVAPKVIDLNETMEGMLKMLRRLIGEDIDLLWHPGKKLTQVKVDPSQIDQILANLCVNSRDAIADVGKITIETGVVSFDEAYCGEHVGFKPGEYVLLAVSDDGHGIDQETLGHIFEPFFTTKEQGKGTGLGLASVYGAVKQNNGFINVYSEPGQGTTFRIYLPKYTAKSASVADKAPDRPTERGHETILLVEDEPAILEMTTKMLERLGYTVLAAGTPGEAVRLSQEHPGRIDLLLTDVVMPEMNGRDLAKKLLSTYPGIKPLFMSGYTANVIAHHGVLDEGVHFIQKPFSMRDVGGKLRETLVS